MKELTIFKKAENDYTRSKIEFINFLQKKCKELSAISISRQMGKDDTYVYNMLFKKPYISSETLIAIAETIEVIENGL